MNESEKKIFFFLEPFFFKQWKINFWEKNEISFNTYLNFNLFYLFVVNFL